jgi:hypothetical protein
MYGDCINIAPKYWVNWQTNWGGAGAVTEARQTLMPGLGPVSPESSPVLGLGMALFFSFRI